MNTFRAWLTADRRSFAVLGLSLLALSAPAVAEQSRPAGTVVVSGAKAKDAATAQAARAQADRLAILTTEFNSVSKELATEQASKKPDPANVARLQSNLAALTKEIELAKRIPVPAVTMSSPPARSAQTAPASVTKVTETESQPAQDEPAAPPVRYEGWDIFQNFGRKGSKP
jgi:hypothetical protein